MRRSSTWLCLALIVILLFGTFAVTMLTVERQQFDAPLITLAEDSASQLKDGASPAQMTTHSLNLNTSLDDFMIVYDRNGRPVAGTGYLNGKLPTVPFGVLTAATGKEYSSVTWQPQNGLRFATVSVSSGQYYILMGASLRIGQRTSTITDQITALGCLLGLVIVAVLYGLNQPKVKRT